MGGTAAGSTLALSAGSPATNDAAGFAALTFTEVGGVEKIGTIGATFAKTEFQPLKGGKQKYKGSADYGSLQPSIATDESDAGQALMQVASADETSKEYMVRVMLPDKSVRYSRGRVFGFPETIDGADAMLMANPTIELNTKPIKVPAPA